MWPFKTGMLIMLFAEKVVSTNQLITNHTFTASINLMTLGGDPESSLT